MKKILALFLAAAMAASMAACSSSGGTSSTSSAASGTGSSSSEASSSEAAPAGNPYPGTPDADMVTVDMRAEPPELNSILTQDVASGDILRMCISGLYKLDSEDKPIPDLAESYEMSEDGKTYTLKLRQDAKWTNGDSVTAKDFVFSWLTGMSKETASVYGFILYDNIKNGKAYFDGTAKAEDVGVKAIDDYTLQVEFNTPLPYALHLFSFATYYPMNQKAYESIGADKYGKDTDKLVTNGPYKLTEWVHDDHILMEKDESHYNAAAIEIPKVKYLMLKDVNARMNAFKAGQLDNFNLTGEQMAQIKPEGDGIVTTYINNSNWYFQFNCQKKGLDNAKIRRAISMAVDKKLYCDSVAKDGSVPATGFVPTTIMGANGKLFSEARGDILADKTPDKAKAVFEEGLKEAGITAADLKLTFITDDTTNAQKEAAFFQAQWQDILGIKVDLTPMKFAARLDNMNNGNFDIVFAGWAPDYNDPMTFLELGLSDNPNNNGKYNNPAYDELIKNARAEVDVEKRQQMLVECEKILAEDAPFGTLDFSAIPYATSAKLQGLTRTGFQEFDFTDGAKIVK